MKVKDCMCDDVCCVKPETKITEVETVALKYGSTIKDEIKNQSINVRNRNKLFIFNQLYYSYIHALVI